MTIQDVINMIGNDGVYIANYNNRKANENEKDLLVNLSKPIKYYPGVDGVITKDSAYVICHVIPRN